MYPVLAVQGRQVEQNMPKLPEAAGPRQGGAPSSGETVPERLLVFGESTAAGVGVQTTDQTIACGLVAAMNERGRPFHYEIVGKTGTTANKARVELLSQPHGPYDLVIVMLGVNDVLAMTPADSWRKAVTGVVDTLLTRTSPGGRLILTGVPRVDTFPILPQPLRAILGLHARGLDTELAGIARGRRQVTHLPVPPVPHPRFVSTDGFHPSALGYSRWVAEILQHLDTLESGTAGGTGDRDHAHGQDDEPAQPDPGRRRPDQRGRLEGPPQ